MNNCVSWIYGLLGPSCCWAQDPKLGFLRVVEETSVDNNNDWSFVISDIFLHNSRAHKRKCFKIQSHSHAVTSVKEGTLHKEYNYIVEPVLLYSCLNEIDKWNSENYIYILSSFILPRPSKKHPGACGIMTVTTYDMRNNPTFERVLKFNRHCQHKKISPSFSEIFHG